MKLYVLCKLAIVDYMQQLELVMTNIKLKIMACPTSALFEDVLNC